jgi:hypothetical protein
MKHNFNLSELNSKLPPIISRDHVEELLGGIISSKRLANLDSLGEGPKRMGTKNENIGLREEIMNRFIRVLQKDIVTDPEKWKDAGPGKFMKLPDRAKRVYCVLSVIAFSAAGNAEGKFARNVGKLGKGWFWTSHAILQQLTGNCQKTVQRAIKELKEAGFIGYHPAKKNGHKCFFKIKRIQYNTKQEDIPRTRLNPKTVKKNGSTLPGDEDISQKDLQASPPKPKVLEGGIPMLPAEEDAIDEAMEIKKEMGDEAFLKYMFDNHLEDHLTPEYREKYSALKN